MACGWGRYGASVDMVGWRKVNIRQLQYFYLAACYGSFSEAARAEGVSVQAVSKAIIELEEELGSPLFVRGGRSISLTPLGRHLVTPAREAIASFDAVGRSVEAFMHPEKRGKPVELRLALVTPPFAKHEIVCSAFSQLISHMVGIKTRIELSIGADAWADLCAGNIDAMITVGSFEDPRCTCLQLGTVAAGALVSKKHPLSAKRVLSFADLAPYPVLYNEKIDSFNETILVACRKAGLTSPVVEVTTDEGVADFLERRDGYVLGIHLKALDIKPLAVMHKLDPKDAPAIPVCLVALRGQDSGKVARLHHFICNEFPLMKRILTG